MKKTISKNLARAVLLALCSAAFAEQISFSAKKMSGSTAENSRTVLEGEASISTESLKINADKIELAGDSCRYITASGNVRGKSDEDGFDFTCAKLNYDRKTGVVTMEGNASLRDERNGVSAKSQLLEYNMNTKVALLQIEVNLTNKNSVCTGALAIYRQNEKTVELTGTPKIVRSSDVFRAQRIMLDMESEEVTLDGKVRGSVSDGGGQS